MDRSFVNGLGVDAEDTAIVTAVVGLGRALGLTTIAEGVETAGQSVRLRDLGCDLAQGYHYGRPESGEHIMSLVRRHQGASATLRFTPTRWEVTQPRRVLLPRAG